MTAEPAGESGGLETVQNSVWNSGCPVPPGRPRRAIRRTFQRTIRRRCAGTGERPGTGKPRHAGSGGRRQATDPPRGGSCVEREPLAASAIFGRPGATGHAGEIGRPPSSLHVSRCPARSPVRCLRGRGLHRMLAMRVRYGCPGAARGRERKLGGEDPGRRFSGEASASGGDVAVTLQDAPRLSEQALDPRLHPAVGLPLLADVLLAPEPDRNVAMRASRLRRRQRCQKLVFVLAPRPPSPFRGTPPPETLQRSASRSISTGSLSPQS